MFVYKAAHLVHIAIDDDVEALINGIMFANVLCGKLFRHDCGLMPLQANRDVTCLRRRFRYALRLD
jgi:hypothetical protein